MYLIVNRVGSIVPLVKPLDIRKFESSSYQALVACFNPYRAFLKRSSCIASIHAESAIASLMVFGLAVLTVCIFELSILLEEDSTTSHTVGVVGSVEDGVFVIGGVSYCLELSMGEEDLLTLKVPALKNSSYRGPKRRSNSCCDESVVSAEEEKFYSCETGPELS
ncbi:hypothetical protein Tco_0363187 [Tanacetum coccineum]